MRAAMYMPGLRPGSMSWSIYRAFRDGLRDAGIDFRIVTDPGPVDEADPDGPEILSLPGSRLVAATDRLVAPLSRNASFVRTFLGLRRWLVEQDGLQLLYMENAYPPGVAAALARRAARWPGHLVLTPMGEDFLVAERVSYGHRRYPVPDRLLRWALRDATGVRCISPVVERWLRDGDIETGPRLLLPLNVAPGTVAEARRRTAAADERRRRASAALRSELQTGDRPLVGSLGRLHPFKGIHVLVEAMAHLEDAVLVVAGPSLEVRGFGDYRAYLERLAKRVGVAGRTRFLGRIDHARVPDFLAGVDTFVVPSVLESLNRVCVEAAATGTPFVVTSSTGISELLPDEPVGVVVPPEDPRALAEGIVASVARDRDYDRDAARRWARGFDARRIAPTMADWLRSLDGH